MPAKPDSHTSGSVAAGISNDVVKLLYEYTGRGPTKARTEIHSNSVVVLLADTLTKGERVLVENGQSQLVLQTRREFQRAMRTDLVAAVERRMDTSVIAFMSENHIDPDMAVEVFILAPPGDHTARDGADSMPSAV